MNFVAKLENRCCERVTVGIKSGIKKKGEKKEDPPLAPPEDPPLAPPYKGRGKQTEVKT